MKTGENHFHPLALKKTVSEILILKSSCSHLYSFDLHKKYNSFTWHTWLQTPALWGIYFWKLFVHPVEGISNQTCKWPKVMEMQEDTWKQYLVVVNTHTQCNRTANQTLRQNATLHQTLHCNKSTTHCTAAVAAEAKKNFPPPSCTSSYKTASGFSPLPSSGSNHMQRFSKPVMMCYWGPLSCCRIHTGWGKQVARYDGRRNFPQLEWERIKGSLCPSQKCRGLLSASTLTALPSNVFSCPTETQNGSNVPDLWSCSIQCFLWSLWVLKL